MEMERKVCSTQIERASEIHVHRTGIERIGEERITRYKNTRCFSSNIILAKRSLIFLALNCMYLRG